MHFMIFTALVDLWWMFEWLTLWSNEKYFPEDYWESGIHSFTQMFCILAWILKARTFISVSNNF
jgi:hypothetical protein